MLELLEAGGWAMAPIVVCSVMLLAMTAERLWALRRSAVMPPQLRPQVRDWVKGGRIDPAHLEELDRGSPLGALFATYLRARPRGRQVLRERVEDRGRSVMHDLERFLGAIGTIALVSPLLGLLGTVIGMVRMFLAIMTSGAGDTSALAGGIGEALVCTAAGLLVAVPAYIIHRWLRGRVANFGVEMERELGRLEEELDPPPAAVAAFAHAQDAGPVSAPIARRG